MRHARGRASQPRGGFKQRARRVLPLALVTLVSVAAFTTWAGRERSAERVAAHVSSRVVYGP